MERGEGGGRVERLVVGGVRPEDLAMMKRMRARREARQDSSSNAVEN